MTLATPCAKIADHKADTLLPREQEVLWDMDESFLTSGADLSVQPPIRPCCTYRSD